MYLNEVRELILNDAVIGLEIYEYGFFEAD